MYQIESVGISGIVIDRPGNEEEKECLVFRANGQVYLKPKAERVISAIMITDDPIINPKAYKYINYRDSGSY